jgi:hypothetical protein
MCTAEFAFPHAPPQEMGWDDTIPTVAGGNNLLEVISFGPSTSLQQQPAVQSYAVKYGELIQDLNMHLSGRVPVVEPLIDVRLAI